MYVCMCIYIYIYICVCVCVCVCVFVCVYVFSGIDITVRGETSGLPTLFYATLVYILCNSVRTA